MEIHLHSWPHTLHAHTCYATTWFSHATIGLRVLELLVVVFADQSHSVASKHRFRSQSLMISREPLGSRASFPARPHLCDILHHHLSYVSLDPKSKRLVRLHLQLYT